MSAVVGINFVKYNTVNHSRIHQVASGYNGTRIINMCSAILNGTGRTVRSGHLSTAVCSSTSTLVSSPGISTIIVTDHGSIRLSPLLRAVTVNGPAFARGPVAVGNSSD